MPFSVSGASHFQSRRFGFTVSLRSFLPLCSAGARAARACSAGRAASGGARLSPAAFVPSPASTPRFSVRPSGTPVRPPRPRVGARSRLTTRSSEQAGRESLLCFSTLVFALPVAELESVRPATRYREGLRWRACPRSPLPVARRLRVRASTRWFQLRPFLQFVSSFRRIACSVHPFPAAAPSLPRRSDRLSFRRSRGPL